MNEKVSIVWHDLSLEEMIYVQAVVMPEIIKIFEKYAIELVKLKGEEYV